LFLFIALAIQILNILIYCRNAMGQLTKEV
jgi:hypothetical protein